VRKPKRSAPGYKMGDKFVSGTLGERKRDNSRAKMISAPDILDFVVSRSEYRAS